MPRGSTRLQQQGFTVVVVLAVLALLALATDRVVVTVATMAKREREEALIQVGAAYADAARSYYLATPGSLKRWPTKLDDLVEDRRFVQARRHIRQLYPDPISRSLQWGLVRTADGGIAGVHSLSREAPLRTVDFEVANLKVPAAVRYSDWQFAYPTASPGESK